MTELASSAQTAGFEWPTQDAAATKLLIPKSYKKQYGEETFGQARYCTLDYDSAKDIIRVLLVKDEQSADADTFVLDTISPNDMIGANIQINIVSEEVTNIRANAVGDDPLPNEPTSPDLNDAQGSANLSLYVYPRLDPSKLSWMNWCGVTTYHPQAAGANETSIDNDDGSGSGKTLKNRFAFFRTFSVAPAEDMASVSRVVQALTYLAKRKSSMKTANAGDIPPKYLIIVNPMSGPKRNGIQVCEEIIVPMLEQAAIEHDLLVTTHPRHATEYIVNESANSTGDLKDISQYDALLTVGGDGVFHEVMQGLRVRPDGTELLQKLKVGLIPCGSANGMAMSLAHASEELCTPMDAMFLICKGRSCALDISYYETQSKAFWSHLTFTWSIIADIDIESEKIHFMGKLRFDIWGALRTAFLRTYPAKFSYLPVPESQTGGALPQKPVSPELPPLSEPIPGNWKTMDEEFAMLWVTHVSHAAQKTYHAPPCKLQEGFFYVLVVRGPVSRYRMARILIGLDDGSHSNMDKVEWIKCSAFRLEPKSTGSFNDLDGEVVESGPVQAKIMPSTLNAFCDPTYL